MLSLLLVLLAGSAASAPLFERQATGYPDGSQAGPAPKPEWLRTYNASKLAGQIPAIPPSTLSNGNIVYPSSVDSQSICSWTLSGCFGPHDIYEAPDGMYGVSFDDGPLADSPLLYDFLRSNNQTATHFYIGGNVRDNPQIARQAFANGQHIGVHTYTHPHMTTLSDTQIVGELGWTIQIIHDFSGGYVPRFWRPPYGDADNRVRAIAENVFGLTLVGWNKDSDDWCLNDLGESSCGSDGPSNLAALEGEISRWINSSSSPGIIGLEHELSAQAINAFINTYPKLDSQRWDARCIPDLFDQSWYQNAHRNETPVLRAFPIGAGTTAPSLPSSSSSTLSTASSSATAVNDLSTPSPSKSARVVSSAQAVKYHVGTILGPLIYILFALG